MSYCAALAAPSSIPLALSSACHERGEAAWTTVGRSGSLLAELQYGRAARDALEHERQAAL